VTNNNPSFSGTEIILASASRTRRAMLEAAGIRFQVCPANIDEDETKRAMIARGDYAADIATDIANALAEQKARHVAPAFPGRLVLGSDQVLQYDGGILSKPVDRAAALDQLKLLRGGTHALVSGVCILLDGEPVWQGCDTAHLTMRHFSDDFAEAYLDAVGDIALDGPGAYRIEGLGAQLFADIKGSHFTILGLPLPALLDYLRREGVLMT
jgi:septum formation protein